MASPYPNGRASMPGDHGSFVEDFEYQTGDHAFSSAVDPTLRSAASQSNHLGSPSVVAGAGLGGHNNGAFDGFVNTGSAHDGAVSTGTPGLDAHASNEAPATRTGKASRACDECRRRKVRMNFPDNENHNLTTVSLSVLMVILIPGAPVLHVVQEMVKVLNAVTIVPLRREALPKGKFIVRAEIYKPALFSQ
jgi:hypothetical protein